jgi:hypothetical protein
MSLFQDLVEGIVFFLGIALFATLGKKLVVKPCDDFTAYASQCHLYSHFTSQRPHEIVSCQWIEKFNLTREALNNWNDITICYSVLAWLSKTVYNVRSQNTFSYENKPPLKYKTFVNKKLIPQGKPQQR